MNQPHSDLNELMGQSPSFKNVLAIAQKISAHDMPILLEGEKGTGKKSLARMIHFSSPRSDHEFIVIDCSVGSDAILESELFGYVKGSFAGALNHKKGLFELADNGTLYFDHISKLKPTLQARFAHFLDEDGFYKLGGIAKIKVNVRIIASTEDNLKELMENGKFREDLYYKLSSIRINLPPLRERKEDILLLAHHYLNRLSRDLKIKTKELSPEAIEILMSYSWLGNVRELEQEIKQACLVEQDYIIGPENFQHLKYDKRMLRKPSLSSLKEQKRKMVAILEKEAISEALKKTQGNRSRAAQLLSVSRQELIRKIARHKIKA